MSSRREQQPSRLANSLLRLLPTEADYEGVAGDLHEEYERHRRGGGSRWNGRLYYWRKTLNDENSLDPDLDERVVSPFQLQRAHEYIEYRFPKLAEQPVIGSRVCQTEYTPDGNFIIDRHPDYDNLWIVGGGSGHGFKHGPAVGELAADRVLGRDIDPEFQQAFAFKPTEFPQEKGSW